MALLVAFPVTNMTKKQLKRQSLIWFRWAQSVVVGQAWQAPGQAQQSCDQENKDGISHIWEDQGAEKRGGLLDFPFYSVSNASPCMVVFIFRMDLPSPVSRGVFPR